MNNQQKQQPPVTEASGGLKEESAHLFRFVKCTNCRRLVDIVGEENYCGNYNGRCPVCTAKMILSPPVPSEPMTCDDFIDCVNLAGWEARGDAQHNSIRVLWDKIQAELPSAPTTEAKPVTPRGIASEQLPTNFPELENRLTGRRSVLVDKCFGDGLTETETNEARRLELLVDSLFAPIYEDVIAELQSAQQSFNQKRLDDGLEVSHICTASASYAISTNKYMPAINNELFWLVEHRVWAAGHGDGENEDLVIFKFCPWCGVELATLYASPKAEAKESATSPSDSESAASSYETGDDNG